MLSCSPATDTNAPEVIRGFYSSYLQEFSSFPPDMAKLDALKQKHCTSELLARLQDAELEADPFLNVQDFEEGWSSTMTIASVDSDPDLYNVCVPISYDKSTHCVQVKVKKVEEDWKIDEVLF